MVEIKLDVSSDVISEMTEAELLPSTRPPGDPAPAALDATLVRAVVTSLRDVIGSGGHVRIAQRHGVTLADVRRIERLMAERLAELASAQVEPEPVDLIVE